MLFIEKMDTIYYIHIPFAIRKINKKY